MHPLPHPVSLYIVAPNETMLQACDQLMSASPPAASRMGCTAAMSSGVRGWRCRALRTAHHILVCNFTGSILLRSKRSLPSTCSLNMYDCGDLGSLQSYVVTYPSFSICSVLLTMFSLFWRSASGQQQALPLKVVKAMSTPNGFSEPPRGWNSFGLQANPDINPSFTFDQEGVIEQANALLDKTPPRLLTAHDYYISLDSGWSIGDHGDDNGRITYDTSKFDLPALSTYLHSKGLKLGIYVLPGAFCKDSGKSIYDTSIPINATLSGNNNGFARCDFDFSKDGVQQWHDATVALFASW